MNPPYGRGIGQWVAKAYDTARAGHPVVCLVPVRTDTVWWQRFVEPFGEVEQFIKGRHQVRRRADRRTLPVSLWSRFIAGCIATGESMKQTMKLGSGNDRS